MLTRTKKKIKTGTVLRVSSPKSIIVTMERSYSHPRYKKIIKTTGKLMVHDEKNECQAGDKVKIMETRPLSKQKKWRVVQVLERAK